MSDDRILPQQLALELDMWVDGELHDAATFDNRELLDTSGTFSLHRLAARIYAQGWEDGERTTDQRVQSSYRREAERARAEGAD